MLKKYLSILVLVCIASLISFSNSLALPTHDSQGKELPSLAPMLEKITPSVVNVSTRGSYSGSSQLPAFLNDPFLRRFFKFNIPEHRQMPQSHALGSGVIVDAEKGYVLTNNHVIDDASEIVVTLKDGRKKVAELIGTDPQTDIALLKIETSDLTAIHLADSDKLQVGDFTLAIGHPFGLGQTVTSGIISGLERSGLGIEGYENFIQTDASINPGNSGGALVNLYGELIGINTAIFSKSGGNIGIGFAIPVNMARSVMDQLIKYGSIQRGVLGVQIQDLTPELASAFGVKETHGAIVAQVIPGSAASKAGVKAGDIIVAVNNKPVGNSTTLRNYIGLKRPGDAAYLKILRGSKSIELKAIIGSNEQSITQPVESASTLGFDGKKLHPSLAGALFGNNTTGSGVQVLSITPASPAWQSGLRKNDRIIAINRYRIDSIRDLQELSKQKSNNAIALNIHRGNSALFLVLQ